MSIDAYLHSTKLLLTYIEQISFGDVLEKTVIRDKCMMFQPSFDTVAFLSLLIKAHFTPKASHTQNKETTQQARLEQMAQLLESDFWHRFMAYQCPSLSDIPTPFQLLFSSPLFLTSSKALVEELYFLCLMLFATRHYVQPPPFQ